MGIQDRDWYREDFERRQSGQASKPAWRPPTAPKTKVNPLYKSLPQVSKRSDGPSIKLALVFMLGLTLGMLLVLSVAYMKPTTFFILLQSWH